MIGSPDQLARVQGYREVFHVEKKDDKRPHIEAVTAF